MKKTIISILLLLGTFSIASAEVGVKIGLSGNLGVYEASGFETEGTEKNIKKDDSEAVAGMGSIFVEKTLDFLPGPLSRLSIGFDHVPHSVKTPTESRSGTEEKRELGEATVKYTNQASATLSNINTFYVTASLTDFLYVKAGMIEMDIKTTEELTTGSTYKDTSTDGYILGLGVETTTDNGLFARFELNQTELDGVKLQSETNVDNSVTLDDVSGTSARISIGKAF
tara:strand:- start:444 stop:1124 length:681 start_codon:yes stop_codon:yes gene_type:complete